jgi:hypothetical protein
MPLFTQVCGISILGSSRVCSVPLNLFVSLPTPMRGGHEVVREEGVLVSVRMHYLHRACYELD